MKIWLAVCFASLLVAWGCAKESVGQFQERIDAAKAIDNVPIRDQAMQKIAQDAADENNPGMAFNATGAIETVSVKDDAAAYCSRKLDKKGNRVAAEQFVHMISNSALRDQIHMEFALEAPPTPEPPATPPAVTPPATQP